MTAFFIGLFPATGLRLIQRSVTVILGVAFPAFKEDHPLSMLEGLNAYQEDRLQLEGIENLQNLACTNIVDLMLKTRFPVEQIVDWIDQSLLCLHTGARPEEFRRAGLRTATDFLDAYDASDLPKAGPAAAGWSEQRQRLAALVDSGQKPPALFDAMAIAMRSDPNMFHIRYWRTHAFEAPPEDIERIRISADLQLMQGLYDEAIEIYNNLLRDFPTYPSALLFRGLAHFSRKEYAAAIADYTEALARGGRQWVNARYAYVERGRALRQLEDYEQAVKNYQTALQEYSNSPRRFATRAAVEARTHSVLREFGLDSTRLEQFDAQEQTLTRALKQLEATPAPDVAYRVRLERGYLYQQQNHHDKAAADFEAAIRIFDREPAAYIFLATAQFDSGNPARAEETLQQAISLDPELASVHLQLGEIYLAQNKSKEAEETFSLALQLTRSGGNLTGQVRAHRNRRRSEAI